MVARLKLDAEEIKTVTKSLPRLRLTDDEITPKKVKAPAPIKKGVAAFTEKVNVSVHPIKDGESPKLCSACNHLYWKPCNGKNSECGNLKWNNSNSKKPPVKLKKSKSKK